MHIYTQQEAQLPQT